MHVYFFGVEALTYPCCLHIHVVFGSRPYPSSHGVLFSLQSQVLHVQCAPGGHAVPPPHTAGWISGHPVQHTPHGVLEQTRGLLPSSVRSSNVTWCAIMTIIEISRFLRFDEECTILHT